MKEEVRKLQKDIKVSLFDLVISLTNTADLISPFLVNHHKQVAYIAYSIAEEMALPFEEQKDIMLAGLLHDLGGISIQERVDALHFELDNSQLHAEIGYRLLKNYHPFEKIADIIHYHHTWWNHTGANVPLGSHILHLADRIAVSINKHEHILLQSNDIFAKIEKQSSLMFMPELIDVFRDLAKKEYFWLDAVSQYIVPTLQKKINKQYLKTNIDELLIFANIFSKVIDFRSPFTANHSSGVAIVAEALALLLNFSPREQQMIKIAGLFHDVGKLAIPPEILEKPGPLTRTEYNIVKSHSFYTYHTLAHIAGLNTINKWSSFHHERLDGTGYPFRLKKKELPLGSRVLAVADVFTAISEDRPYRRGMDNIEAIEVLKNMVKEKALDPEVVDLLLNNYVDINTTRISAQTAPLKEYQDLRQLYKPLV